MNILAKKHKNTKKQAPGPGGIDRTRREAFNAPNESSVSCSGSLVGDKTSWPCASARLVQKDPPRIQSGLKTEEFGPT